MARSWAITGVGLDLNVVRAVGVALIAIVVVGFALAALSTVGIVAPSGWWQATVAVSAIASVVLLVLCVEPQLVLGLGIDAVLLAVVATGAWTP
jgi:predicted cupin superfamily sugar epimerase